MTRSMHVSLAAGPLELLSLLDSWLWERRRLYTDWAKSWDDADTIHQFFKNFWQVQIKMILHWGLSSPALLSFRCVLTWSRPLFSDTFTFPIDQFLIIVDLVRHSQWRLSSDRVFHLSSICRIDDIGAINFKIAYIIELLNNGSCLLTLLSHIQVLPARKDATTARYPKVPKLLRSARSESAAFTTRTTLSMEPSSLPNSRIHLGRAGHSEKWHPNIIEVSCEIHGGDSDTYIMVDSLWYKLNYFCAGLLPDTSSWIDLHLPLYLLWTFSSHNTDIYTSQRVRVAGCRYKIVTSNC